MAKQLDGGSSDLSIAHNLIAHVKGLHRHDKTVQNLLKAGRRTSFDRLYREHLSSHDRMLNDGFHGINYRGEI